jgi:N-acetyl sugar amidotransferase
MIRFCKTCLMPNTRPRIVFSEAGICNACLNAETRQKIDWAARRQEFLDLVEEHRRPGALYDCVIPWSGGKDSSYIAHRIKFEFGLNPLLVTFAPLVPTDIGMNNRRALLELGFDHVYVTPSPKIGRHLAQRFFIERGNPKVGWDAGINAVPVQVAVNYDIPLIFYAEHGESEYGGRVLRPDMLKIRDFTEVLEHQIGDDPRNWLDDVVTGRDLAPYLYPPAEKLERAGVKALYFAYFFPWDVTENFDYIKQKIPFQLAPNGRSDGTFTGYDSLDDKIDNVYYYLQFIKFGFGRALRDACRQIYRGRLSREDALKHVRNYDDEFPHTYFDDVIDYLGMNREKFDAFIDMHRNEEIWEKSGNGWILRHPPA